MGLTLAIEQQDDNLNAVLRREGIAPVSGTTLPDNRDLDHMPYAWFGLLRRAYARLRNGLPPEPARPYEAPADATDIQLVCARNGTQPFEWELMTDIYTNFRSHLVCHGDSDGFYVPSEFAEPIYCDEDFWIGSLPRLIDELCELAEPLQITLQGKQIPPEVRADIFDEEGPEGFLIERMALLVLLDSATLALLGRCALSFC